MSRPMYPLLERFRVKYIRVPASGCWLWTDCVNAKGYGRIFVNGKARSASRISYQIHRGHIPTGKHVLHTCDMPSCVNPKHLFIGTNSDNQRDSMLKDRRGLKLSILQALAIRNDPRTQKEIARDYGIHHVSVGHIKRKKTWRHLP